VNVKAAGLPVRILLIEDNTGDAFLIKRAVGELPEPRPTLVHAKSLTEGLTQLKAHQFDLVLTDLNLPDSDGLDTCRTLCETHAELPIVVLTGSLPEMGMEAIGMGAQDYLIKERIASAELMRVLFHAQRRHLHTRHVREMESRFRQLLTASPAVIYSSQNMDQRQSFISDNAEALLGHKAERFTENNGHWLSCIHEADRSRILNELSSQTTASIGSREYRFCHGNGAWIWIRDQYRSLPASDGQKSQFVGYMIDISEQKVFEDTLRMAMEAAQAASQAKNAFLGQMSHELRTPLNAILGFGELLRDMKAGDLNEKQVRFVDNILRSGQHLLGLITDVLDLTKIEAGKMTLNLSSFNVETITREVIDLVQSMAVKKNIAISFSNPGHLPLLSADEVKFRQILYNALSNALKFTPADGKVSISCKVIQNQEGGGTPVLQMNITDTGIGVDPDELENIFGEFIQIYSSENGRQPGTGLGLTLTRRLVDLHGGRIWAESKGEGQGLTMMIELPFGISAMATEGVSTVVVVEAGELDRELLVALLESMRFRVVAVEEEEKAMRLIVENKPDLVVMNVEPASANGLDLVRCLRLEAATRSIPIIALSSDAERLSGANALAAGCSIHMTKPLEIDTFKTVVNEILRTRRRLRRRLE
jgi:PAS domain S-box-containing protein